MTGVPLAFEAVAFSYPGNPVFRSLSLEVRAGDLVSILGPNGSGKTTLVRLACGIVGAASGTVRLGGDDVSELSPREVARRVAVVPQEEASVFSFSVEETVLMGRTPWVGRFGFEGEEDRRVARESLAAVEAEGLAGRDLSELSGGERQRVLLARALAQRAPVLLLDEPTSHLDLRHQVAIHRLLRRLRDRDGLTVVVISHDVNLAARFSDRLVLLAEGGVAADGPPAEVLRAPVLTRVYGTRVSVRAVEGHDVPWVVPE